MGSARSDGNTRNVVNKFSSLTDYPIVDLNLLNIGHFDYDQSERQDDFLPTIHALLERQVIVFATPVYWYSMSALMKNFFDRITDLLEWHKETGRQLRGKSMALLSCGSGPDLEEWFPLPFVHTAEYLGMDYLGHLHTWVTDDGISLEVEAAIQDFAARVRHIHLQRSDNG